MPSHYLNQWWPSSLTHINALPDLSELYDLFTFSQVFEKGDLIMFAALLVLIMTGCVTWAPQSCFSNESKLWCQGYFCLKIGQCSEVTLNNQLFLKNGCWICKRYSKAHAIDTTSYGGVFCGLKFGLIFYLAVAVLFVLCNIQFWLVKVTEIIYICAQPMRDNVAL